MPYSSVSEIPSYVGKEHSHQWLEVFNSVFRREKTAGKSHEDAETSAFKQANGVIKKAKMGDGDNRLSATTAQYMELPGAVKDSDCNAVKVDGGVSSKKGMCMEIYTPKQDAASYSCSTCIHIKEGLPAKAELNDMTASELKSAVMSQIIPIFDAAIEATKAKPSPIAEPILTEVKSAQLSDRGQIKVELCGLPAITAIDGKPVQTIPIACAGTWHKNGHEFSITDADMQQMVQNFQARKNGMVEVDFEHASESPEVGKGGPVIAAGWIRNLSFCSGNLLAQIEWTPRAEQMIHDGEYRFFSPAIDWEYANKETGESQGTTLTSGALTNHPFLEELPPIHLSDKVLVDVRDIKLMDMGTVHVPHDINKNVQTAEAAVTDAEKPVVPDTLTNISVAFPNQSASDTKSETSNVVGDTNDLSDQDFATVSGTKVNRSDFLYAPAGSKPSEWKLPVHDESHIRNALARFNQTEGLPDKAAIRSKLVNLAKKHGIDTSGFEKAHMSEGKMAKIHLKKFEDGPNKGRFGMFADEALMGVMPASMAEDAMKAKCAELNEALSIPGMDSDSSNNQGAIMAPAGEMAAEGSSSKKPNGADNENNLASKSSVSSSSTTTVEEPAKKKLSDADALKVITYPATDKKRAGRISLSECSKAISDGKVDHTFVFAAQAAEKAVDAAIETGKFPPKNRPYLMKMALSDVTAFEAYADASPVVIKTESIGHEFAGDPEGESASQRVSVLTKVKLSEMQKTNKDARWSTALQEVKNENPDLYKDYIKETRTSKSVSL